MKLTGLDTVNTRTIYCADQVTWHLTIQLWSARSGHCLVQVGTVRQSYNCSKNIYFIGS